MNDIKIERYDELPKESREIRRAVFVEEQGFKNEFDEKDNISRHFVAFFAGAAVGTCRVYFDAESGCCVIGRVAVRREWRGRGLGEALVRAAEADVLQDGKTSTVRISAQVRAVNFYKKLGYAEVGEYSTDEGVRHTLTEKTLDADVAECHGRRGA